jgi:hypothetical protein
MAKARRIKTPAKKTKRTVTILEHKGRKMASHPDDNPNPGAPPEEPVTQPIAS